MNYFKYLKDAYKSFNILLTEKIELLIDGTISLGN